MADLLSFGHELEARKQFGGARLCAPLWECSLPCGHHIDESKELLVLRIVTNSVMPHAPEALFKEERIILRTGEIIPDG